MSVSRCVVLGVCVAMMSAIATGTASAQAAAAPVEQEDLTLPVPAEPTFILINLPTTLRLPKHKMSFNLTHRFQGDLTFGSFGDQLSNLFGLDNGAVIGFEFRFAPVDHLQVVAYRNTFDKTFQFSAQYDKIRQRPGLPVSISPIVSIEGLDNFSERFSPALGAVVSHTVRDKLALYAHPVWVHNVTPSAGGGERGTFFMGVGARYRLGGRAYLVGEVAPRLAGFAANDPEYGFGIESRVGGHMFSLTFTNGFSTTYGQIAGGGLPDSLFLGFNLGRKFF